MDIGVLQVQLCMSRAMWRETDRKYYLRGMSKILPSPVKTQREKNVLREARRMGFRVSYTVMVRRN